MICYEKLLKLFNDNHYTEYTLKRDKIISQETFKKLRAGTGLYQTDKIYGSVSNDPQKKRITAVDTKTIEKLCSVFSCQPSDIMEYIPNTWDRADDLCKALKCTKDELPDRVPMEEKA